MPPSDRSTFASFVCTVLPIALLGLLTQPHASAQDPTIFSYTLANIPHNLIIVKGAVIEISGALPPNGPITRMQIRSRNVPKAEGRFTDKWSLRWNTADELNPTTALTVWQDYANVPAQLIKVYVRIVDSPPFRLTEPKDNAEVFGPVQVAIPAAGDLKAAKISLTVDGNKTSDPVSQDGTASLNPQGLAPGRHLIGAIAQLEDGSEYVVAPVTVNVAGRLTAVPFETGDRLDTYRINGNIALRARIAPDIAVSRATYKVDDQTVEVRSAGPFDLSVWNPASVKTGQHTLTIEVTDKYNATLISTPYVFTVNNRTRHVKTTEEERAPVRLPHIAVNALSDRVIPGLEESSDVIYSLAALPSNIAIANGMTLKIVGHFDKLDAPMILVQEHEKEVLASWDRVGEYTLAIPAEKLAPGKHQLTVGFAINGVVRVINRFTLTIYKAVPVRLVLPKSANGVVGPVTLSVEADPLFAVQSITYYKDYRPIAASQASPITAYWDTRSDRPGVYDLWALVTGADGSTFRTHTEHATIPVRIGIVSPSGTIRVDPAAHKLEIKSNLADGIVPTLVEYKLDDELIAARKAAPFDTAAIDPNNFRTGVHKLIVSTTDSTGATYVSEKRTFGTAITAEELMQVQHDVELRVHLDELARLRRRDLDNIRDRIAAAGGEIIMSKREGRIGASNGLIVNVDGIRFTFADGSTEDLVSITGQIFTVESSVRNGSGRVTLSAAGDNNFELAAENAAACDRALNPSVDWQRVDCVFSYPGATGKIEGNSTGAANATALASSILELRVDNAVAMTGTVNVSGDIGDVGGVKYKAKAALSSPAIRTLIVPNAMGSLGDLDALYEESPELFINHHFVFVTKIGEVLRQAIIGYDPAYEQAQSLYRSALSQFLDGEDEDALEEMQQASSLTPEDQTMKLWLRVMRDEEQKPVEGGAKKP